MGEGRKLTHECRQEGAIGKLFEKLEEIKDEVSEVRKEAALTNQLLTGIEDAPGLVKRVAKLEVEVGKLNMIRARFAAIGAFIGCIITALISFFK